MQYKLCISTTDFVGSLLKKKKNECTILCGVKKKVYFLLKYTRGIYLKSPDAEDRVGVAQ